MSSRQQPQYDVVDPLTDDPLAFLYESGDEEEEDNSGDHPGYASLMGCGPRSPNPRKKTMAIELDAAEAQRAAEVMEINAGQLMTNPDRSHRQVGFLGLDPLDAMREEEDEDALAETLEWDADAEVEADAECDADDAGWQPENPLAGTGYEEEDDDSAWQPENPLAGTGFEEEPEWEVAAEPEPQADVPQFAEAAEWTDIDPVVETPASEPAEPDVPAIELAEAASLEPVVPEAEPVEAEATFEEPEWDVPAVGEALPEEPASAFEVLAETAHPSQPADDPWTEFAGDSTPDWPVSPTQPEWVGMLDQASGQLQPTAPGGNLTSLLGQARAEQGFEEPEEPEFDEPEYPGFAAPEEPEWPPFDDAAPEAEQAWEEQPDAEQAWEKQVELEPAEADQWFAEPEDQPEPEIEILRFPALSPVVEVPHHSLRARVLKSQQGRTTQSDRVVALMQWIGRHVVRLYARLKPLIVAALARVRQWIETARNRRPTDEP